MNRVMYNLGGRWSVLGIVGETTWVRTGLATFFFFLFSSHGVGRGGERFLMFFYEEDTP